MGIFKSPYPPLAKVPDIGLSEWVCSNPFNVQPDRIAAIEAAGTRQWTFKQMVDAVKALMASLSEELKHTQQGDVVGVFSPNTFEYGFLAFALSGIGLVPAMINPSATPSEMAHSLKVADKQGPKALFVHPTLLDTAQKGWKEAGFGREAHIILMGSGGPSGMKTVPQLLDAGAGKSVPFAKLQKPAKDTLAFIFYSSGTTGAFKGVELSHHNLVANAMQLQMVSSATLGEGHTIASFLPMYHIYSTVIAVVGSFVTGTKCVYIDKFELPLFLKVIQDHKVTMAPIVPPVAVALAKHPIVDQFDLSSLRTLSIAAAPTKMELQEQLRKRLRCKVVQGYGMTESAPGSHTLLPEEENQLGSVGRLWPGMEAKIIDLEGKELGVDEEGEICMRGPNIFMGYRGNPEATASTKINGWLHTGDIGRVNAEGFFWIVDRLKELIKVRGFQVAPAELEGVLLACPLVLDAAVTATYDDEKATEVPKAFVVVDPKNKNEATRKEIREFVDSRVTYYKKLAGGVHFLDEIPKNPSGKILRRLLPRDTGATGGKAKAKL